MAETGELGAASGLGMGETTVVGACASDINVDGRQCVAFFHKQGTPGLFFSRGFSSFGIARKLAFDTVTLKAADALGQGQTAGLVHDMNGDGAADLLSADAKGGLWVMYGQFEDGRPRRRLTVAPNAAAVSPVTVTAAMTNRRLGTWVVRPGQPVTIGIPRAGPVELQWSAPDTGPVKLKAVVTTSKSITLEGPGTAGLE
jgi:hypothetical protein